MNENSNYYWGKGVSTTIMFAIVSQPWNGPVSQPCRKKHSHQSSAPCVGSGREGIQNPAVALICWFNESLVKSQDALGQGGPSDSSPLFPAKESTSTVLHFGFNIAAWRPTTSVSTGPPPDRVYSLEIFLSPAETTDSRPAFIYVGLQFGENLTSWNSSEMITVRDCKITEYKKIQLPQPRI